jgi:hypothetical protein
VPSRIALNSSARSKRTKDAGIRGDEAREGHRARCAIPESMAGVARGTGSRWKLKPTNDDSTA